MTLQDFATIFGLLLGSGVLAGVVKLAFNSGEIVQRLKVVEKDVDSAIKPDLKQVQSDLKEVRTKVEVLWRDRTAPATSPRTLNPRGEEILEESGIQQIVSARFEAILSEVKAKHPENAYQAEQHTIEAVALLKSDEQLLNKLQDGAFKTGASVDEVLFVAAIHLRDKVLRKLDMKIGDIDRHQPK